MHMGEYVMPPGINSDLKSLFFVILSIFHRYHPLACPWWVPPSLAPSTRAPPYCFLGVRLRFPMKCLCLVGGVSVVSVGRPQSPGSLTSAVPREGRA